MRAIVERIRQLVDSAESNHRYGGEDAGWLVLDELQYELRAWATELEQQEGRDMNFTGVKVFSATKVRDRDELGEKISTWLRDHPAIEILDKVVMQSSDQAFHCLSITLFFRGR
jgi:hypothetical protein